MTTTNLEVHEIRAVEDLHEMLRSPGPCLTLTLPAYHPGEQARSQGRFLKASLQNAAIELRKRGVSPQATSALLGPLQQLAEDPALLKGSATGRIVFRSENTLKEFVSTEPRTAALAVGSVFAIRPMLPELTAPRVFYILAVARDRVSLKRCTGHFLENVDLPRGVPATLDDAMELEPPDHDLENRSAAGHAIGAIRRVRFGTGSGRETVHAHLSDFYKLVDRGICKMIHQPGIPLVLAGVDEEVAAYRAISGFPNLASESVHGSLDMPPADMVARASTILRREAELLAADDVLDEKERGTPNHFLTEPAAILRAAFEGRVHRLYLNEDAERFGDHENASYRSWGREDLLNLAAVQTILHRGTVYELPGSMMPDSDVAAAVLRY